MLKIEMPRIMMDCLIPSIFIFHVNISNHRRTRPCISFLYLTLLDVLWNSSDVSCRCHRTTIRALKIVSKIKRPVYNNSSLKRCKRLLSNNLNYEDVVQLVNQVTRQVGDCLGNVKSLNSIGSTFWSRQSTSSSGNLVSSV